MLARSKSWCGPLRSVTKGGGWRDRMGRKAKPADGKIEIWVPGRELREGWGRRWFSARPVPLKPHHQGMLRGKQGRRAHRVVRGAG